jgi:hypothetical protein
MWTMEREALFDVAVKGSAGSLVGTAWEVYLPRCEVQGMYERAVIAVLRRDQLVALM